LLDLRNRVGCGKTKAVSEMLEVEYETLSGIEGAMNVKWLNVYDEGEPILVVRMVNEKVDVYQFDQGGE